MKHTTTVESGDHDKRIDLFVGSWLTLSRAQQKALFDAQAVRVNGRKVKKGMAVKAGDSIEVDYEKPSTEVTAEGSLEVLYEDADLVFVNKPAGVPVQPLGQGETGTIANALLMRFPEMREVGDDPREAGLCHRLDIETSGVLLAAKNRTSWLAMREAFGAERQIEKHYLALVTGPLAEQGSIEIPLAHRGNHVRPVFGDEKSRPALTEYVTLRQTGRFSFVDVTLVTGVLHQVRAHLAAVGAPLLGDVLYEGEIWPGLSRFFLHAHSLAVTHPTSHAILKIEAPLPQELQRVYVEIFGAVQNRALPVQTSEARVREPGP
jgi:23S rRNA pseudouridine1911/1915/1917 synthase